MADRINAEKAVRKSIEAGVFSKIMRMRGVVPAQYLAEQGYEDAQGNPTFPIWWPNKTFFGRENQAKPPFYVRVSHHPAPPRIRTVGANPRILLRGHSIVGCFVPEGVGQDLADNLSNAVMEAYPLEAVFSRDGFDTFLENVDPKPAFGSLGRWYLPVHINWNCWRST